MWWKLLDLADLAEETFVGGCFLRGSSDGRGTTGRLHEDLSRLTRAQSGALLWKDATYSYDAMGNMLQSTIGGATRAFAYQGSKPSLASVTEDGVARSVGYDTAGNEISVGPSTYQYSARNSLVIAPESRYAYDARGVRIITVPSASPVVQQLTVAPATVSGGTSSTATVTTTAAPTGGAAVHLFSENMSAARVPPVVLVSAGSTSATFSVATSAPLVSTSVRVSAAHAASSASSDLTVLSDPIVVSLTLAPASIAGPGSTTGTITLDSAAPPGGSAVALAATNGATLTFPSSVTIAAGSTSATFTTSTSGVSGDSIASLTATLTTPSRTTSASRDLPLYVPRIASVNLDGAWAPSNSTASGAVVLGHVVQTAVTVTLASSDPSAASVPASVVVPAGSASAPFTITTYAPSSGTAATITATLNGTASVTLTIMGASQLSSITLYPANVVGGVTTSRGSASLSAPAGSGGATITLTSSHSAASVPQTVVIAEGATSAPFTVTTSSVAASTPVTINAMYGVTRSASLVVGTCGSWVAAPIPFGAESVWLDDAVPPGASSIGPWSWTTAQKTSGTSSRTGPSSTGATQWYFQGASYQSINYGGKLVTYALLDPCDPPEEILLGWGEYWGWEHRAYWGANLFTADGIDGTNSRRRIGDLPPAGEWVRLAVPAERVGLDNDNDIHGMTHVVVGGKAWFDRTGFEMCPAPQPAAPTLSSREVPWYDDNYPAGSTVRGYWNWDSVQKASGTQSHFWRAGVPETGAWFENAPNFTLAAGETLYAWVLVDPCDPPLQILLAWIKGTDVAHRAYWGQSLMNYGTEGTESRKRIGDIPAGGQWIRLEVNPTDIGLDLASLNGMQFFLSGGKAWFDRPGKLTPGSASLAPIVSEPVQMASAPSQQASALPPMSSSFAGSKSSSGPEGGASARPRLARRMLQWVKRVARRDPPPPKPDEPVPTSLSITMRVLAQTGTEPRRYSFYSPELQLLAETNVTSGTPTIAYEYVWFNGEPIAQVDVATQTIKWTFTDHLGTPILQTNATAQVVWRAEREPYGKVWAIRAGADQHQPLGFPGQEHEQLGADALPGSDRLYNIFRWYRGGWGRYTQADPIGLEGGSNLYAYVGDAPLTHTDPLGLAYFAKRPLAGAPWIPLVSCNPFYSFFNVAPSHEQLFFEDGQSPQSMGFFSDGSLKEEQPAVGYKCKSGKFDDCIMREAVKQSGTAPYCLLGKGPNKKFNCQDWATLVRGKYKQLEKDESVKKKCCKASSAGGW